MSGAQDDIRRALASADVLSRYFLLLQQRCPLKGSMKMTNRTEQLLPPARTDQLVVKELEGETLVYDLDTRKAHCLNQTASLIWKNCTGRMTISETTLQLSRDLNAPVEDEFIWLGLRQLDEAHLLQEQIAPAVKTNQISRRRLAQRLGIAALLLPVVASIHVAPAYAQASNCLEKPCESSEDCCPTQPTCAEGHCF
jgi:hypothetical protein